MKKFNSIFQGTRVFMFSLGTLFLLSFSYMLLNSEALEINEHASSQLEEEDFSHCDQVFDSANFFCPGNYLITGTVSPDNGCSFQWLGNLNCQGITTNVSQSGNTVSVYGTGAPGAFCKFFYRLSDDHGWSQTYMIGIRFYEENNPECCVTPPCE